MNFNCVLNERLPLHIEIKAQNWSQLVLLNIHTVLLSTIFSTQPGRILFYIQLEYPAPHEGK